MSKKVLVITATLLSLIIAGSLYLLNSDGSKQAKQTMQEKSTASQPITPAPMSASTPTPEPQPSNQPGAYLEYKDGIIASTAGTKLIFFHAPWCPQCRDLEASIKANGVPNGVAIIKVDYDTNRSLRQKYGVTLQTTVVRVNDSGELVKKFVAYDDPSLQAVKNNLL